MSSISHGCIFLDNMSSREASVSFVATAEFNHDVGNTLSHIYPSDTVLPAGYDQESIAARCLPAGAHLRDRDNTILILHPISAPHPPKITQDDYEGCIYGISCFENRKNEHFHRGACQKALVLFSKAPLIAVFKPFIHCALTKLLDSAEEEAVQAGTKGSEKESKVDYPCAKTCNNILRQLYEAIHFGNSLPGQSAFQVKLFGRPLLLPVPPAFPSIYSESSVWNLVRTFGSDIMIAWAAVLSGKRICVVATLAAASIVCDIVLALPLLVSPLAFPASRCTPYFDIATSESLRGIPGLICGCTNPLFKDHRSKFADLIIDVDNKQMNMRGDWYSSNSKDKQFFSAIFKKKREEKWVRKQFELYTFAFLKNLFREDISAVPSGSTGDKSNPKNAKKSKKDDTIGSPSSSSGVDHLRGISATSNESSLSRQSSGNIFHSPHSSGTTTRKRAGVKESNDETLSLLAEEDDEDEDDIQSEGPISSGELALSSEYSSPKKKNGGRKRSSSLLEVVQRDQQGIHTHSKLSTQPASFLNDEESEIDEEEDAGTNAATPLTPSAAVHSPRVKSKASVSSPSGKHIAPVSLPTFSTSEDDSVLTNPPDGVFEGAFPTSREASFGEAGSSPVLTRSPFPTSPFPRSGTAMLHSSPSKSDIGSSLGSPYIDIPELPDSFSASLAIPTSPITSKFEEAEEAMATLYAAKLLTRADGDVPESALPDHLGKKHRSLVPLVRRCISFHTFTTSDLGSKTRLLVKEEEKGLQHAITESNDAPLLVDALYAFADPWGVLTSNKENVHVAVQLSRLGISQCSVISFKLVQELKKASLSVLSECVRLGILPILSSLLTTTTSNSIVKYAAQCLCVFFMRFIPFSQLPYACSDWSKIGVNLNMETSPIALATEEAYANGEFVDVVRECRELDIIGICNKVLLTNVSYESTKASVCCLLFFMIRHPLLAPTMPSPGEDSVSSTLVGAGGAASSSSSMVTNELVPLVRSLSIGVDDLEECVELFENVLDQSEKLLEDPSSAMYSDVSSIRFLFEQVLKQVQFKSLSIKSAISSTKTVEQSIPTQSTPSVNSSSSSSSSSSTASISYSNPPNNTTSLPQDGQLVAKTPHQGGDIDKGEDDEEDEEVYLIDVPHTYSSVPLVNTIIHTITSAIDFFCIGSASALLYRCLCILGSECLTEKGKTTIKTFSSQRIDQGDSLLSAASVALLDFIDVKTLCSVLPTMKGRMGSLSSLVRLSQGIFSTSKRTQRAILSSSSSLSSLASSPKPLVELKLAQVCDASHSLIDVKYSSSKKDKSNQLCGYLSNWFEYHLLNELGCSLSALLVCVGSESQRGHLFPSKIYLGKSVCIGDLLQSINIKTKEQQSNRGKEKGRLSLTVAVAFKLLSSLLLSHTGAIALSRFSLTPIVTTALFLLTLKEGTEQEMLDVSDIADVASLFLCRLCTFKETSRFVSPVLSHISRVASHCSSVAIKLSTIRYKRKKEREKDRKKLSQRELTLDTKMLKSISKWKKACVCLLRACLFIFNGWWCEIHKYDNLTSTLFCLQQIDTKYEEIRLLVNELVAVCTSVIDRIEEKKPSDSSEDNGGFQSPSDNVEDRDGQPGDKDMVVGRNEEPREVVEAAMHDDSGEDETFFSPSSPTSVLGAALSLQDDD
ncbi:hypothetical protein ADUPG1_012567 [Aduncisulcus paluster]|uniref:UDENN domain-containing protein n=1 Tax=Aduncisulcus paluster TaxID=2918883 RepID=A0ABQ5JZV4_9EUKA|nr:hypothetical protein ADUPG1_012567 [Aduncisulcus paluster]